MNKPEPYTGPVWRVEGRPKTSSLLASTPTEHINFTPIEEYSTHQSALTRLRYWQHEFPFRDLFVWRVTEQAHPPISGTLPPDKK